ncbi:calcium-binding protein [Pseudohongiella acticola]|uniref:beta strand repeat-containing protein n=1 Tax=Pseudohongiella acticola TaxID=1524254 RepID=UPI0030EBF891
MATQETRAELITLVVAMFDAAPGVAVLSDLTFASDAGVSNAGIAASLANSAEFKSLFPVLQTNAEFVNEFVDQMVGSLVSEAEKTTVKTALTAEMNAGATRVDVILTAIAALKAIPTTDAVWGNASAAFANKVEVATFHTVEQEQPSTNLADLQNALAGVTNTAASVTAAKAAIDDAETVGETLNLTTGVDALSGGAKNDTFVALIDDNTASANTLGAADVLNGGAGTDRLNILIDSSAAAVALPAANITNIENIFARNVSGQTFTLDATRITGESQIWADRSTSQVDITGIAAGTTLGIKGDGSSTNAAVNATYATSVTSGAVAIDGDTTGGAVAITAAAMTSMTIASTGGTNVLGSLATGAALKSLTIDATTGLDVGASLTGMVADSTITVTGAGAVDLGTAAQIANVDVIDASGNAGGITVHLDDEVTDKFTGSSGADTVQAGSTAFTATSTGFIKGGAGTDILYLDNATVVGTLASGNKISEFETVRVNPGLTVDLDNLATNNTITAVQALNLANGAVTFSNLSAAAAGAVTLIDAAAGEFTNVTLGVKGASTVGQLDTVKVTLFGSATTSLIDVDNFVIADVETLDLAVFTAGANVVSALTHQDWSKLNISGTGPLTLTSAASVANVNTAIDASSASGALTLNFAASTTNGISITGGTGMDTLTGTNQNDIIKGGAGNDTITGGDGADTLTGGDGVDQFAFAAGASAGANGAAVADVITDFVAGTDNLQFTGVADVVSGQQTAVQTAVTALAAGSTDGAIAEAMATANTTNLGVSFAVFGGNTYVLFETTGANNTFTEAADVFIKLTGVTTLPTFAADVVA